MRLKDQLGRYGERIAAQLLLDSGLRILDTNWRCPRGEIDIVAAAGRTLVICETPRMNYGHKSGRAALLVGPMGRGRARRS